MYGGSRSIGAETAEMLTRYGTRVIIVNRMLEAFTKTVIKSRTAGLNISYIQ